MKFCSRQIQPADYAPINFNKDDSDSFVYYFNKKNIINIISCPKLKQLAPSNSVPFVRFLPCASRRSCFAAQCALTVRKHPVATVTLVAPWQQNQNVFFDVPKKKKK